MVLVTTLTVPAVDADLAADRLWSVGARAVEERTLDDRIQLRTTLGDDDVVARARLGVIPDGWHLGFEREDDRPAATWREFAKPIEVTPRLTIRPAWQAFAQRPEVLDVAIEPGGSFGLGDHPTTRLSAAATDRLVTPGDAVLDVGCGSGVLSIIAARRGASVVRAIDIAEEAREATVDNARRNGVEDLIDATTAPLATIVGEFDLVVANILAPALLQLADDLQRVTAPDGHLVISGVLVDGYTHVVDAMESMEVVDESTLEGWAAVTLRYPAG